MRTAGGDVGGDLETFALTGPEIWLRVDNNVGTFALPIPG